MRPNYYRFLILDLCKKERTVTELKNLTNLSFGTLSYHLKILKSLNLLSIKKEVNKKGQPTYYKTI
jgi:predicted transcriptional regulator